MKTAPEEQKQHYNSGKALLDLGGVALSLRWRPHGHDEHDGDLDVHQVDGSLKALRAAA